MEAKLNELKARLFDIADLQAASAVLAWDRTTYMPPGGAAARSRQVATLSRTAHEKFTEPAVGNLLDDLQPWAESLPYGSDDASLVRVTRRVYDRMTRVPAVYVAELNELRGRSYAAWAAARPADDFAAVEPFLEQTLDLSRKYAEFFPGYEHIADPLIDVLDYGLKASTIRELFGRLRQELAPLAQSISALPPTDDSCLHQDYPRQKQELFFMEVVKAYGYDLDRGRQDVSPHPFTISFSITDVRFTVRYRDRDLGDALFSALHECGHALYEQGVCLDYEGTSLAHGTSSAVHESQSRLWENIVGRGRAFWSYYYPQLQAIFPDQLRDVSVDTFYRAVNAVKSSLIRVDADEVTYNLHVMLRFQLELDLLEGNVAVHDLPEVWRERYQADLGVASPDDRDGVLQDMHWFFGSIGGMFQGYTLGNILSSQFYDSALQAHPEIPSEIEQGRFDTLHGWLKDQIYQHGSKFTTDELVQRVTGGPLRIEPYVTYLRGKYGELYQ